ncbi:family 20 glycosylhydrolase [Microbacterium sp. YJN-G]|uniref:family 20 glycosylhydrolase n=1 Tax=Microbacterium sp. YJN-G TaxID=2763257 RepID=UPI0018785DFB|nr:family 20 glycosylhydrolase [Microbacterium sp. YJN-G]
MPFTDSLPLIPLPARVSAGDGVLELVSLGVEGHPETAALLRRDLADRFGADAAESDAAESDAAESDAAGAAIILALEGEGAPESHTIDSRGESVRITAPDAAGLFYGTRTLLQLLHRADTGWALPRLLIEDAPRFAYRGVMLDVARHFFGVDDVKTFIDRAAALKFNHLHLHLTDDQGWRIQIDSWPLLTERAASGDSTGGAGGFFTKADYAGIVDYATRRHITVVPEIDLPGHTHAVGVAYPDLVEQPWLTEQSRADAKRLGQPDPVHGEHYAGWAVGHSSVRIHDERTYGFVTDVLTEVAEMTPGPYLHVGGDECLGTPAADFAAFFERVTRIAAGTGKTPVAWHEAGAVQDIAEGTIGQYWGSVEPKGSHAKEAIHFVERGGALIMSPSDRTYLDMKPHADFLLGLSWAGIVPLRLAYDWEPADVVDVPESAILGVEAPLWSETIETFGQSDALVYPRVTAHAEVAWSPRDAEGRTWESYRSRLEHLAPVLRESGVQVTLPAD